MKPDKFPPKRYEDITGNWYPDATPNSHQVSDATEITINGVTYRVDGKNVQLAYSKHEKEIAEFLEREIGGEIYMLPKVNKPEYIKTPDYLFNGKLYDLKTLTGNSKDAIFNRIAKSSGQANRFIVDISNLEFNARDIENQIYKIFWHDRTKFVDEVVLISLGKIILVVKRT